MREAATQTIGRQQETDSYQTVKYSQDMATVIRQAVAMHPSRFLQFALVTIEFHFDMDSHSRMCSATREQSTLYLLNAMRAHTGQSHLVWLKETTCYFLFPEASPQGGDIVQHRLWKALAKSILIMSENTIALPCAMTIGHSTYPEPSPTIEQCLNDALTQCAMQQHNHATQAPSLPAEDLSIMARQFGVPYLSFLPRTFSNKIKRLIRPELAQELRCFPLGCARNTLTVAMSNPQDNYILDRLKQETGMHIFPVLIHPDELQNALEHMTR
jgi:Type II secretion system (T2SS), protein E, N-terminal domain